MQKLSAELVAAQESERGSLSRELHDQVGQMLSALMLTLGNLGSSIKANNPTMRYISWPWRRT